MLLLSIFTGTISLINYYYFALYNGVGQYSNYQIALQVLMVILSVIAIFGYKGRRVTRTYWFTGYRMFTIRFSLIIFSFMGSASVLFAFLNWNMFH